MARSLLRRPLTTCKASLKSGASCTANAVEGQEYCSTHLRIPQSDALTTVDQLKQEIESCVAITDYPVTKEERRAAALLLPHRGISQEEYDADPDEYIVRFKGLKNQAIMPRCRGVSKLSGGERCSWPAARGSLYCKFHGGNTGGLPHGKPSLFAVRRKALAELSICERVLSEYGWL